jgi:hypothetical protein
VEGSDLAQAFQARQCRSHAPVEAMLQYGKGLELDPSAILDHVEEGIQAAIDAGVFPRPGPSLQKQVPSWKNLAKGCCTDLLGKLVCTLALLRH